MAMGLIHLLFCSKINIYEILVFCTLPEFIENKKNLKIALKAMMTILFSRIIIAIPSIIIGYYYYYTHQQAQEPIYLNVKNVGSDGSINITTIVY